MKKSLFHLLLAALAIAGPGLLFAQPGGGRFNVDPEKRAEQQTANMAEKLSLSEAQTAKVKEINLKYANKMKALRDSTAAAGRQAMRTAMENLRNEQDKELQGVLTEQQWKQWLELREERRRDRDGRQNRRRGENNDSPDNDNKN